MSKLFNPVCRVIYAASSAAQSTATTTHPKNRIIILILVVLSIIVFLDQFIVERYRVKQFFILTCNVRQNVTEKLFLEQFSSKDFP